MKSLEGGVNFISTLFQTPGKVNQCESVPPGLAENKLEIRCGIVRQNRRVTIGQRNHLRHNDGS